jgi:hypothetical protein
MSLHNRIGAFAALLSLIVGCATQVTRNAGNQLHPTAGPAAEAPVPWTGLNANDAVEDFHFVIVSDRTGGHRAGVFRDAMGKVNLLEPAFVLSVGDLIEGYTEDPKTLGTEWDEIESYIGTLDAPFFYAAGNHDMSNAIMAETWRDRFGSSWYAFEYKDVLFLVLNSEAFGMVHDPGTPVPGPFVQTEQMAWIRKTLKNNTSRRWTIVIVHQPLWDSPKIHPDWLAVEKMLAGRPHTVFAGHQHRYVKHRRNEQSYITLATTGGGSPMRGASYGEFDEVAFVTMTKNGPVVANLDIEGIHDEDVLTSEHRAMQLALAKSVQPEAESHDGEIFATGRASFRVRNPTEQELIVQADIHGGAMMVATPQTIRTRLASGESRTIEIRLSSDAGVRFANLESGRIRWTLHARSPQGEPLRFKTEHTLLPEKRLPIPRRTTPVEVDGDLGEWTELPIGSRSFAEVEHAGQSRPGENTTLRFAVEQDEENLYIAARVTDDILVVSRDKMAREQDGLTLQIDARPDPQRSATSDLWSAVRAGEFRQLVLSTASLTEPAVDHVMSRFAAAKPAGSQQAVRRTADGYTVEFSLPLAVIEELQGADWQAIRLNLSIYDTDASDEPPATLWWRPNRFGARAVPASGTFQR